MIRTVGAKTGLDTVTCWCRLDPTSRHPPLVVPGGCMVHLHTTTTTPGAAGTTLLVVLLVVPGGAVSAGQWSPTHWRSRRGVVEVVQEGGGRDRRDKDLISHHSLTTQHLYDTTDSTGCMVGRHTGGGIDCIVLEAGGGGRRCRGTPSQPSLPLTPLLVVHHHQCTDMVRTGVSID